MIPYRIEVVLLGGAFVDICLILIDFVIPPRLVLIFKIYVPCILGYILVYVPAIGLYRLLLKRNSAKNQRTNNYQAEKDGPGSNE